MVNFENSSMIKVPENFVEDACSMLHDFYNMSKNLDVIEKDKIGRDFIQSLLNDNVEVLASLKAGWEKNDFNWVVIVVHSEMLKIVKNIDTYPELQNGFNKNLVVSEVRDIFDLCNDNNVQQRFYNIMNNTNIVVK